MQSLGDSIGHSVRFVVRLLVAACVVAEVHVRENDLLEFCRRGLSGWQVPKRIFFVDVIPVNERGKISRRELARRFASH